MSSPDAVEYVETVKSAQEVIPAALQMEEVFGDASHFITHYGFHSQETNTWNTVVYFGGRYVLTMQVEVIIDYERNSIERMATEPVFYMNEVRQLVPRDEGRFEATYGNNWTLSESEWEQVYDADGDFSVIGIQLKSQPLPTFDEYVESWTRDRIHVSLRTSA